MNNEQPGERRVWSKRKDGAYRFKLFIGNEFNGCVWKNTEQGYTVTLEQSSQTTLFDDNSPGFEYSSPSAYMQWDPIKFFTLYATSL